MATDAGPADDFWGGEDPTAVGSSLPDDSWPSTPTTPSQPGAVSSWPDAGGWPAGGDSTEWWPGQPGTSTQLPVQQQSFDVDRFQGPPWLWLYLALGIPLVVGIASWLWATTWMHAAAWLVVCLAGFGLLVVFTDMDTRRRSSAAYVAQDHIVAPLRIGVIVLTLVFSMWNAWLFADWFARLPLFMGMG